MGRDLLSAVDVELLDEEAESGLGLLGVPPAKVLHPNRVVRLTVAAVERELHVSRRESKSSAWARERPSAEEMVASREVAKYVAGWGRHGDAALVAERKTGRRVGAAWYRPFPSNDPDFGFIDASTPEISIAVVPDERRRGIGADLLAALIGRARQEGFRALSLSVSPENPAIALYRRHGFVRVRSRDPCAPPPLSSVARENARVARRS